MVVVKSIFLIAATFAGAAFFVLFVEASDCSVGASAYIPHRFSVEDVTRNGMAMPQ